MVLPHAVCPLREAYPGHLNVFDISLSMITLRYEFRQLGHGPISSSSFQCRRAITNVDHAPATSIVLDGRRLLPVPAR